MVTKDIADYLGIYVIHQEQKANKLFLVSHKIHDFIFVVYSWGGEALQF